MEGETCDATGTCARHADALQEARRCEAAPMSRRAADGRRRRRPQEAKLPNTTAAAHALRTGGESGPSTDCDEDGGVMRPT
eukprot:CAMPEP_0176307660 /NCGR_PEP_ID=MMETSP0121_2-20121125/64138_1 /TAXON_ID=160619 /ORGANISM="Kryptoperidinium foliaceum, Strain CCMP 1326" /LENGTH=80 /DNA_ID=CAMNT_0017649459 /DNA_START=386 /DNA_END=625 /DNA_ORIENTATION=-